MLIPFIIITKVVVVVFQQNDELVDASQSFSTCS